MRKKQKSKPAPEPESRKPWFSSAWGSAVFAGLIVFAAIMFMLVLHHLGAVLAN